MIGRDNVECNPGKAIVYFNEAINRNQDYLAMYNLALAYNFNKNIKSDINETYDLLIKSSQNFDQSLVLLSLILVKQVGCDIEMIKQKVEMLTKKKDELLNQICDKIYDLKLYDKKIFDSKYNSYNERYYIYNALFKPIPFSDLINKRSDIIPKSSPHKISSLFYEGFGICI